MYGICTVRPSISFDDTTTLTYLYRALTRVLKICSRVCARLGLGYCEKARKEKDNDATETEGEERQDLVRRLRA